MKTARQVWKIARAGSLDRLSLREEAIDFPGPGEVRVRVGAVGLNFADVFACLGLYSATPRGEFVPGLEFAGVVEETEAEEVSANELAAPFKPGDRVMGVVRFGGYATRINAQRRRLRRIPAGWSFAEGAAFGVQALTAWYALSALGNLKAGQTVLVHSGAGGVGLNALNIVGRLGGVAVATVGSASKKTFLTRRTGLAGGQVLVRDRRRFAAQLDGALAVLQADGFDLVLDAVTGPYFQPGYDKLRPGGRLVVFGAADLMPGGRRPDYLKLGWRYLRRPRIDPLQMIADNKSVMGFNLIWLWDRIDLLSSLFDELAPLFPDPPWVGKSFPFAEAPAALRFLQSGQSVGKVVLEVE